MGDVLDCNTYEIKNKKSSQSVVHKKKLRETKSVDKKGFENNEITDKILNYASRK